MNKIIKYSVFLVFLMIIDIKIVNAQIPSLTYQAHGEKYGWQNVVQENSLAGTTGQYKRMEAIKINLTSDIPGNIEYSAHVAGYGWLP